MRSEKRRSRESFTRALERIAARMDQQPEYEFDYYCDLFRRKENVKFRVNGLWAFGSWARGALDCGDLDLIADVAMIEGNMPYESVIRRVLIKRAPGVHLYIGTPEQNSSRALIEDAVLIWSPSNRDWKANLQTIKPDPTATRYARPTDAIPIRNEQLNAEIDVLEELIALRERGVLDWSWTAFSAALPDQRLWSEDAKKVLDRVSRMKRGRKTCEALKKVIDWFEHNDPIWKFQFDYDSPSAFWINGIRIHIGRPSLYYGYLDHHFCAGIMLVPHLSRHGPNGIWAIRRGDQHPLVKQFQDISAYCFLENSGEPVVFQAFSDCGVVTFLALFRTDRSARDFAKALRDEGLAPMDEDFVIDKISGESILGSTGGLDQITIDSETFAISPFGRFFDGEEIRRPEPEELREILMGENEFLKE